MNVTIQHTCKDASSYRAERVKSLFNCEDGHRFQADFNLPLETLPEWRIGLVVGPSGSGKTSLGNKLGKIWNPTWPVRKPIIDAISPRGNFDQVTGALAAVGLGSVPAWLRPHSVLSNGEQFRANLARLVAEPPTGTTVLDEFTSVVDRQIAKVGAAAFAKAWRRNQQAGRVVALSCHYDVADWLQPDWIFDTATGKFAGGCLRRRPEISLTIHKVRGTVWKHFEPHHYLKLPPMVCGQHYVGFIEGEPVAHIALSPKFENGRMMRACRLVVMPEWQGIGVGLRFLEEVCNLQLRGENRWNRQCFTLFHTSHPALVSILKNRPGWLHVSAGLFGGNRSRSKKSIIKSAAKKGSTLIQGGGFGGHLRAVHGFKYIGTTPLPQS